MTTPNRSSTNQRDLSEFVSYLLDGSGVENVVDLHRLRRELEDEASTASRSGHNTLLLGQNQVSRSISPASTTLSRHRSQPHFADLPNNKLDESDFNATSTPLPNSKKQQITRSSSALIDSRRQSTQSQQQQQQPQPQLQQQLDDPSLTIPSNILSSILSNSFSTPDAKPDRSAEKPILPRQPSIPQVSIRDSAASRAAASAAASRQSSMKAMDQYISQISAATTESKKNLDLDFDLTQRRPSKGGPSSSLYAESSVADHTDILSSLPPPSASERATAVGTAGGRVNPYVNSPDDPSYRVVPANQSGVDRVDESLLKIYREHGGLLGAGVSSKDMGKEEDKESARNPSSARVNEWIASSSLEKDPADVLLTQVSNRLDAMGLPSLHASLFQPTTTAQILPTTITAQKHHLARVLNSLLDQLASRTQDCQNLADRVSESLSARQTLEHRISVLEADAKRGESKDWKIIQEQQDSLQTMSSQIAVLKSDLLTAKHDAEDAKHLHTQLKKRVSELESEKIGVQAELDAFRSRVEKQKRVAEATFERVRGREVGKGGAGDRVVTEVVEVYEGRLEEVRREVAELRAFKQSVLSGKVDVTGSSFGSRGGGGGTRVVDLDTEIASLEGSGFPTTRHFVRQGVDGEQYVVSLDSHKMIHAQKMLEEQVKDLQDRLEVSQRNLRETTQQAELLRLQLLENKRPQWVEQARSDLNTSLSTRELIRRDKKSWKMKLYQIDAMNLDECRTMLKSVCIHLAISSVPSLLPGLAAIDHTLRLLPQLQSFISKIDELVKTHYTSLFSNDPASDTSHDKKPFTEQVKNLDDLVRVVSMWAKAGHESEGLKEFRRTIHRALGVRESGGSVAGCLEVISRLKERVGVVPEGLGSRGDGEYKQVLEDVCRVLEVREMDGRNVVEVCRHVVGELRGLEEFRDGVCRGLRVRVSGRILEECLEKVEELKKGGDGVDERMDEFLGSLHRVLGVNRRDGSLEDCLEVVRVLVEKGRGSPQVQKQNHELYSRIVTHFMELFEVKNVDEVLTAVNELYVMWAEKNAGVARLRSALRNCGSVDNSVLETPGLVLAKAADLIDSIASEQVVQQQLRSSLSGRVSQSRPQNDASLDPFNDAFLQAVASAAKQDDSLGHVSIPLDWADEEQEQRQQFQQQPSEYGNNSRTSVGQKNRSWNEISSSIRSLTSGFGAKE